jgi:hypothetical protein
MRVDGKCHCGAIVYEAEVEPGTIGICHCLDCQQLTGSPFRANISAPAGSFHLLKGQPRQYIKTGDSGAGRVHAFCEMCGTPIYSCAVEDPPTYSLRLGGLSQRAELGRPARQIYTKRRLSWVFQLDEIPAVQGQPDS